VTVQELIDKLEKIRDKDIPVVLVEWSKQDIFASKADLTTNRIVVQPHRVALIVE